MINEALKLLKKINDLGYEAYIVGGYPRDKYLGLENPDVDICSNIDEEVLFNNFEVQKNGFKSYIVNNFELTLFRKDIYNQTRYPEIELVQTLKEDLQRRDFTINTLCIDYNNNYVDLLDATKDLDNKIIKTVKNPLESIKEDPLRIIRAFRFKIDLAFELDKELESSILNNLDLLKTISTNKIYQEIDKIKTNKQEIFEYIGDEYERKSN